MGGGGGRGGGVWCVIIYLAFCVKFITIIIIKNIIRGPPLAYFLTSANVNFFAKNHYLTFMMLSLHAQMFRILSFLGHQLETKAFVKTLHHQPSGLLISCTNNCRN